MSKLWMQVLLVLFVTNVRAEESDVPYTEAVTDEAPAEIAPSLPPSEGPGPIPPNCVDLGESGILCSEYTDTPPEPVEYIADPAEPDDEPYEPESDDE